MSVSKRHHYNPRYYLRRFENAEGRLWRLDLDSGHVVCGSSDSFGFKKNWNSFSGNREGFEKDWLEKRISQIDDAAANELSSIVSEKFPERLTALPYAISFMQNHQPLVREHARQTAPEVVDNWPEDYYMITSARNAIVQAAEYQTETYTVSKIPDDLDARFLTSSNPLIKFYNKEMMFFPLSDRLCLMLNGPKADKSKLPIPCGRETVEAINTLTKKNSWQYVFSNSSNFSS